MTESTRPAPGEHPSGLPYPLDPPVVRDDLPDRGAGAPASWGRRAGARLLDLLLVSLPATWLAHALGTKVVEVDGGSFETVGPWWPRLIFPLAFIVYETVLIAWRGNTVGKYLVRVRAVSWERGTLATYQEAAIRALVPGIFLLVSVSGGLLSILILVPVVIYLSSLTDPVYRGWHDRAADTIVLAAPRNGIW